MTYEVGIEFSCDDLEVLENFMSEIKSLIRSDYSQVNQHAGLIYEEDYAK